MFKAHGNASVVNRVNLEVDALYTRRRIRGNAEGGLPKITYISKPALAQSKDKTLDY